MVEGRYPANEAPRQSTVRERLAVVAARLAEATGGLRTAVEALGGSRPEPIKVPSEYLDKEPRTVEERVGELEGRAMDVAALASELAERL